MDDIFAYLKHDKLPEYRKEAHKEHCRITYYYLDSNDVMYRKTYTGPDLRVVHESRVQDILKKLHEGSCGYHSGGRSLAH